MIMGIYVLGVANVDSVLMENCGNFDTRPRELFRENAGCAATGRVNATAENGRKQNAKPEGVRFHDRR